MIVILNPIKAIESKHYVNFTLKVGLNSVISKLLEIIKPLVLPKWSQNKKN